MTRKTPSARSWNATRLVLEPFEERAVPAQYDLFYMPQDLTPAMTPTETPAFVPIDPSPFVLLKSNSTHASTNSSNSSIKHLGNGSSMNKHPVIALDPVKSRIDSEDIEPRPEPAPMPEPLPTPEKPVSRGNIADHSSNRVMSVKPGDTARPRTPPKADADVPPIVAKSIVASTVVVASAASEISLPGNELAVEAAPAAVEPSDVTEPSSVAAVAGAALAFALPGIDAADLISAFSPIDPAALEESVNQFLDRLRDAKDAGLSASQAGMLSVALVTGLTAGEFARRKRLPQRFGSYLANSKSRATMRTK